jgi:hypothetical protein
MLIGCSGQDVYRGTAAPAPPPRAVLAPRAVAPVVPAVRPGADFGFVHCCGNAFFQLDIRCDDQLMRCYESAGDGWIQTYGRHCERELGDACFLRGCDDRCM